MHKPPSLSEVKLNEVQSVRQMLAHPAAKRQLSSLASGTLTGERMLKLVATSLRTTPALAECDPMSLLGALMSCASLGLEPNSPTQQAYLIPFKNKKKGITEVNLVIGYRGYITLARRTGTIARFTAGVHFDDDEHWKYMNGSDAVLEHISGPQEGQPLHAYAVVEFTNGGKDWIVLPWSVILRRRNASQNYMAAEKFGFKSAWHTHEHAMGRKTAIRDLSNFLDLTPQFGDAQSLDGEPHDFAAFALDPSLGGAPVDIDLLDADDQPKEKPKQEPKRERRKSPPKNRQKPVEDDQANGDQASDDQANDDQANDDQAKDDQANDDQAKDEPPFTDAMNGLINSLNAHLPDCADKDQIEAVRAMFSNEIAAMAAVSKSFGNEVNEIFESYSQALEDDG